MEQLEIFKFMTFLMKKIGSSTAFGECMSLNAFTHKSWLYTIDSGILCIYFGYGRYIRTHKTGFIIIKNMIIEFLLSAFLLLCAKLNKCKLDSQLVSHTHDIYFSWLNRTSSYICTNVSEIEIRKNSSK